MTERKVLNKYFPPDFDPAKIPRLKGMKKEKVFSIRTMAPFNMMCLTCRGYIFKAKKFNSRMEECEYTYLDLKEYRFHIRCPTCCSEIIYRTDRENNDYVVESGAKRSFEAYTTAIRQAIKESAQEKEELEKNPIKALEKRTEESMNEFKMSNKIQDLMEQSKNDGSREEMIEDAITILRQEKEMKKLKEDQEIKELATKQLNDYILKQSELSEKNKEEILPVKTFGRHNEQSLKKINLLKEILKKHRESKSESNDGPNEPKIIKLNENVPGCSLNDESHEQISSSDVGLDSNPSSNVLGLYYDSD